MPGIGEGWKGYGSVAELTEQQRLFVLEYVRSGGRGAEAARAAGFSEHSAGKYAYQLLEKPHVADAIYKEQRRTFAELATIAIGQARMMLEDPKTPPGVRVDLVKTLLDRAGLIGPKTAPADDDGARPLTSYSLEELLTMKAAHESLTAAANESGEPLERVA